MKSHSTTISVCFLGLLETLLSGIPPHTICLLLLHNISPPKLSGLIHQQCIIITYGFCGAGIWGWFGWAWSLSCSGTQTVAGAGQCLSFLEVEGLSVDPPWGAVWASSQCGVLRAVGLLTWKLKCSRTSISSEQKLHHLRWYRLRGHAASLVPHSIGYHWVTSPPRFKGRVVRLHLLLGNSKNVLEEHVRLEIWPQPSLENWKIQFATSQKGEGILENQKCHLQCLQCTKILHLMQRII